MNEPHHIPPEVSSPRDPLSPPRLADTSAPRAPRITLHIEELVLHGAAPGDRHRIADAVQAELHRMIADEGAPAWAAASHSAPRLATAPCAAALSAGAGAFGAGIARAVYQAAAEERPAR